MSDFFEVLSDDTLRQVGMALLDCPLRERNYCLAVVLLRLLIPVTFKKEQARNN